jgi:Protein of unknown function (DUF3618)
MTTREGEARAAERTDDKAETAPGSELSSRAGTSGGAEEPAPLSGSIAAPPNDARQLKLEIERTREQLGETVEELVARVDVKRRVLDKASEVSGNYKSTVLQVRKRAATRAGGVRSQVAGNTAAARQKAASAGIARKELLVPLTAVTVAVIIDCLAVWQWRARPSSATR